MDEDDQIRNFQRIILVSTEDKQKYMNSKRRSLWTDKTGIPEPTYQHNRRTDCFGMMLLK